MIATWRENLVWNATIIATWRDPSLSFFSIRGHIEELVQDSSGIATCMHILNYEAIILILVGYLRCTIFVYIIYQQIRKIIGLKLALFQLSII